MSVTGYNVFYLIHKHHNKLLKNRQRNIIIIICYIQTGKKNSGFNS